MRNIVARTLCLSGFGTCRDAVDELVQEVYLRWLRSDSGFDGESAGAFWSFIRTSVRHTLQDRRRFLEADKRRPRPSSALQAPKAPGPFEATVRHEGRRKFFGHCLAVGDGGGEAQRRRRALALGWIVFGGCTSREAAAQLGVSRSTVDTLIRRLRRRLEKHGVELPRRAANPGRSACRESASAIEAVG
ncbi:MAG: sigma-70 family RNA polymerase sigma factor [Acidobacteriota bacterium]